MSSSVVVVETLKETPLSYWGEFEDEGNVPTSTRAKQADITKQLLKLVDDMKGKVGSNAASPSSLTAGNNDFISATTPGKSMSTTTTSMLGRDEETSPGVNEDVLHITEDKITIHTIQLKQYTNHMQQLLSERRDMELPPPPAMPELPWKPKTTYPTFRHLDFSVDSGTDDSGQGEIQSQEDPSHEIDSTSVRKLMLKSVSLILAHSGYESSLESCLEMLTDIGADFLHKICLLFHEAEESPRQNRTELFPDILEQVFCECGLGSLTNLKEFFDLRIRDNYIGALDASRLNRNEFQNQHQQCSSSNTASLKGIRVKEEPMELMDDNDDLNDPASLYNIIITENPTDESLQPSSQESGFNQPMYMKSETLSDHMIKEENSDVLYSIGTPSADNSALKDYFPPVKRRK